MKNLYRKKKTEAGRRMCRGADTGADNFRSESIFP